MLSREEERGKDQHSASASASSVAVCYECISMSLMFVCVCVEVFVTVELANKCNYNNYPSDYSVSFSLKRKPCIRFRNISTHTHTHTHTHTDLWSCRQMKEPKDCLGCSLTAGRLWRRGRVRERELKKERGETGEGERYRETKTSDEETEGETDRYTVEGIEDERGKKPLDY